MSTASSRDREPDRLAALHRYAVLDSPPEQAFDSIVQLAAQICETPIALITLIDEARQWFKARLGFPYEQTARELAFCTHAIEGQSLCLVSDALQDSRFQNNPMVTEEPKIRFYAGMPIVTPDGHSLGTLCVIDRKPRENLTEHQRQSLQLLARETMTQLELRRALRESSETKNVLEDLNFELEAFSAAVAHDLRAPLRHIEAYTDLLLNDPSIDARSNQYVGKVRAACSRAQHIVEALLRLSRASHTQLNLCRTNLTTLAHEISADLRASDPNRRVDIIIEENLMAQGDRELVRLVLTNLMSNAWKFTRDRSPARIEIGARRGSAGLEYFVRDNGVGFDPARALLPSKPFSRRHASDKYEGVGLGLTIVERILRRHGGSCFAEGQPDRGATVYFTLGPSH